MRFGQITEDRNIVYHGDNFGTTHLDPKWMFHDNSNNQEGVGIYFSPDINVAKTYGPKICSISLDGLIILPSRSIVADHVSVRNGARFIKHLNDTSEDFWYAYSDYGIEVANPEDVRDHHHMALQRIMQNEEIRNWQIELAQLSGNIPEYVKGWNKFIGIDGLYEEVQKFYSIINTDVKVTQLTSECEMRFFDLMNEDKIGPVYHGTERDFNTFQTGMPSARGVQSNGFFFTKSSEVAKGYGDRVISAMLDMEDWVEFDFHGKSRVYFDGKSRSPSELVNRIAEINEDLENGYGLPGDHESDLTYELEDAGWSASNGLDIIDGIIMHNVDDSMDAFGGEITTHYVVYNASQIKNIRKL